MSVSHWRRVKQPLEAPRCQTVVIGAGITGLSAAYELAKRGQSVHILERHTLGWGASSRNAGFLMRGLAENYAYTVDHFGHDTARLVWQWSQDNLALLRSRYTIETLPSYQASPSSIVSMSASETEELQRSAELMTSDGFECELQTMGSDTLWWNLTPEVALVNPHDAAINPWEMVRRMRDTLLEQHGQRVTITENAEVTDITDGAAYTAEAMYPCDAVLVCTNAWASELLPTTGSKVEPNRGQMMALNAPGVTLNASYYLNRGSEYIRQTLDGTIILGGKRTHREDDERTSSSAVTMDIQTELERYAHSLLKAEFTVLARWAGTMGFSPNGLPIIAQAEEIPGNVWFCGGLTGHGMSLGARTAQAAVMAMLGESEPPKSMSGV